jgi:hypothetical protein
VFFMSVSRRRFLKHGAFAAIACTAIPGQAFSGRKSDVDGSGDHLRNPLSHSSLGVSRSAFEGLVGSSFKVTPQSGAGSPVWLRLIKVEDLPALLPVNTGLMSVPPPHSAPAPTTTGYILTLSAGGTSLTQDNYIFENGRMGKFLMFIVPAGPGQYTALFNLLNAPVSLAPSDDHPSPLHGGGPSSGVAPAGNGGAVSGGVPAQSAPNSPSASPSMRPAQEQLEPMFGRGVKTQMPE